MEIETWADLYEALCASLAEATDLVVHQRDPRWGNLPATYPALAIVLTNVTTGEQSGGQVFGQENPDLVWEVTLFANDEMEFLQYAQKVIAWGYEGEFSDVSLAFDSSDRFQPIDDTIDEQHGMVFTFTTDS